MTEESASLHFMMGQYRADIPVDRMYSPRHQWLKRQEDGSFRTGLTAYSVRLLQDVYFLEWAVDEGQVIQSRQEIGEVESSKAVSGVFAAYGGRVVRFNDAVLNDPSAINADCYGAGWLLDLESDETMLSAAEYLEVLEAGWEDAQRAIKGQMNE